MRVRFALAFGVKAFARVLRDIAHRAEAAVQLDRVNRRVASAVIGNQDEPPRRMHGDMRGYAGRGLLIELREFAGLLADRKRRHAAIFLAVKFVDFIRRVKKPYTPMKNSVALIKRIW